MAILLAALSATLFGVGDFFGGLSSRRIAATLTAFLAQLVGLVLVLGMCAFVAGDPSTADLGYGALAGLSGGMALILFYWAMSIGPMSVVAPISAFMSAMVPVMWGLLDGERPSLLAVAGILVAGPAIVLISREPDLGETEATEAAVVDSTRLHPLPGLERFGGLPAVAAALAGVGFGMFLVFLSRTGDGSGLWPIVTARSAAVALALVGTALSRPARPVPVGLALAAMAGSVDVVANSFYLLASRQGLLTLVGVIGAMYPASTIVLARVVLHERMARHQAVGLAVAVVATGLIAAG